MSREFRTIQTDTECKLVLAGCLCGGFDVVQSMRKDPPSSIELASCNCGARHGRRIPSGGWSLVIDKVRQNRERTLYNPFEEFFEFLNGKKSFSISGNPDGSPIDEAKKDDIL